METNNTNQQMAKPEETNLPTTNPIFDMSAAEGVEGSKDFVPIDITEFEGARKKIEIVEPYLGKTKWKNNVETNEDHDQWKLKVQTEVLKEHTTEDGNVIQVRASANFNLIDMKTMPNGTLVPIYSKSENSKLWKFMDKINVTHPSQILGQEVTVTLNKDKNGKQWANIVGA